MFIGQDWYTGNFLKMQWWPGCSKSGSGVHKSFRFTFSISEFSPGRSNIVIVSHEVYICSLLYVYTSMGDLECSNIHLEISLCRRLSN